MRTATTAVDVPVNEEVDGDSPLTARKLKAAKKRGGLANQIRPLLLFFLLSWLLRLRWGYARECSLLLWIETTVLARSRFIASGPHAASFASI